MAPANTGEMNPEMVIPDFEIETLARYLLPKIQAYFDSPEEQAEYEVWKRQTGNT